MNAPDRAVQRSRFSSADETKILEFVSKNREDYLRPLSGTGFKKKTRDFFTRMAAFVRKPVNSCKSKLQKMEQSEEKLKLLAQALMVSYVKLKKFKSVGAKLLKRSIKKAKRPAKPRRKKRQGSEEPPEIFEEPSSDNSKKSQKEKKARI